MTIYGVGENTTHTEAVAAVMVCQEIQRQGKDFQVAVPSDLSDWFDMGGIAFCPEGALTVPVNFGEADRAMKKTKMFYPDALGTIMNGPMTVTPPRFNVGPLLPEKKEHIVLAPFGFDSPLPVSAWRLMTRFLRSYGVNIYMVGEPGERIDLAGFTEAEIYSGCSPRQQVRLVQEASLVVGVPNGFTWTAADGNVPVLILMPEDIKPAQLFPFNTPGKPFRILAYPREQLDYASLIVGLRAIISRL